MWIVDEEGKNAEEIDAFKMWHWRRIMWTERVTVAYMAEQISRSLEALVAKQKPSYFDHIMRRKIEDPDIPDSDSTDVAVRLRNVANVSQR